MKNTLAKLLSRTTAIICAVAILVVGIPFTASAEGITLDKNGDVFVVDFNNSAYQGDAPSGIHNGTGGTTEVAVDDNGGKYLKITTTSNRTLGTAPSSKNYFAATNYIDLYDANGNTFNLEKGVRYVISFNYYRTSTTSDVNLVLFETGERRANYASYNTESGSGTAMYLTTEKVDQWATYTCVVYQGSGFNNAQLAFAAGGKGVDLWISDIKIEKLRDTEKGDGNYVLIPKVTDYPLETPYYTYTVTDGATASTYADVLTAQTYEDGAVSKMTDTWSDAESTALDMSATIPKGDALVACTWKDKPAEVKLETVEVDFTKGNYTGENATDLYNDRGLSDNGNEKISTEVIQKDGKTAYHAKAINANQWFGEYEYKDNAETTDINEKYYTGYHFTLRDTNGETISVTKYGRYLVSFEYYVNNYYGDIQLCFIEHGVGRMTNNNIAQSVHKGHTPLVIDSDNKETSTGRWINVTAVMAAQDNIDNLSIGIANAKGADLYLANMTISKLRDSKTAAGAYALIPDTTEYILEKPYYVYAGGESGATTLTYADIIGTETIYGQDDDSHGTLNWSVDMNTSPAGDAEVACTWNNHELNADYTVDEEAGTHYKTCTVADCPIAKTGEAAHEGGKATCKEQATCSVCGAKYGELGKHGETVEKEDTAKDPTCTEAGKKADKVCSICDKLIETGAAIDAKGHNYTSEVTKPATCDAEGVKTYTCGTCSHSYTEAISAKGHGVAVKDDDSYVAPTCTNPGKEANMVCPDCNAILTEGAAIDAKGHTKGEAVRENVVDATLNAPGSYDEVVYCTVCNEELSRVNKEIAQLTGAAAMVNGTNYGTLAEAIEAAGDKNTVYLLKNIELDSSVSINKNITLDLGIYNITRTTESDEGNTPAILVSDGANVIITGTGTVTANGGPAVWAYSGNVTIENGNYVGANHAVYASGTSTVVINGGKFSVSVEEKYHYVINIYDADRATSTITVNGGKFVDFNPFNNGAEGPGNNFVADGLHGADEDEDGIFTIHKANYTAVVTDPTCEDEGYTTYTCECGHSYVADKVAAKGHTWDDGVITKKPTATEAGEMTYTCSVCGETKPEEIAALGSHEALIKLDVATDVKAQKVTGAAAYDAAASKAIAEYVKALGGKYITNFGVKMFVDGVEAGIYEYATDFTEANFDVLLGGYDLSSTAPTAYYTGMNINQMATVVTFVSYCEYVDANGETQVLEGVAVDYTFDQYLAENSGNSDVQLITAMKDAAANAADEERTGETTEVENGPAIVSTYNLKNLSVRADFVFTAEDMNKLALAVEAEGKVMTALVFEVSCGDKKAEGQAAINDTVWKYMLDKGLAYKADASFAGMNLEEMGKDVTFTAYYIDADGNKCQINTQTVKFIDLIDEDTDAAAYVYAYNGLIA